MQTCHWLLKTGSLLLLGFCFAGGELVRAEQTNALPIVALPAELPPRTAPYEPDPELHAFLARAQRVSWILSNFGGVGRTIQIQDASGRVNGRDAHGHIQTPIPDSIYLPYKAYGEEGFAGTLKYGDPYTLVTWEKKSTIVLVLILSIDPPQVTRTAHVSWERVQVLYVSPQKLVLTDKAMAWLPLPAAPWTTLPALYVDRDGDQQIDVVIEPLEIDYRTPSHPALQQVGVPGVLPPRENPTRVPVEQYERVFTGWRGPPPIDVSKATRVILQRRSGEVLGVDEQGRGWSPILDGPPYLLMGGGRHGPVYDSEEYQSVEIQPIEAGEVGVVMGPFSLAAPSKPPPVEGGGELSLDIDYDHLEIWYGPVAVTAASVLWLELPPAPWQTFPALYLDRDGDQVVDEVIEAHIEIHPYKERLLGIEGVRRIL